MNNFKSHILNELQNYKGFTKKADFARFLGIEPQVLSNWLKRSTFNINILVDKFPEVKRIWLLTGEGEMFISEKKVENSSTNNPSATFQVDNSDNNNKISVDYVRMTDDIIALLKDKIALQNEIIASKNRDIRELTEQCAQLINELTAKDE